MASRENTSGTAEALWRFALALYARPNVAAALLSLQDRAGLNVNLMLFALWLGAVQHRRLDPAALAIATVTIAPLGEPIVEPLRALRRQMPASGDIRALRRRVAALELAAERAVLARLAGVTGSVGAVSDGAARLTLALGNLALVLGTEAGSAEALVVQQALGDLVRRDDSARN